MQPPPYTGGPQPKSKVGIIVLIIAAGCCICCIGLVGGGAFLGKRFMNQTFGGFFGCGTSIVRSRDALLAYAKDHGGKLPPAASWQDDIQKYITPLKKDFPFKMPTPGGDPCDLENHTSICYNSDLAGKKVDAIKNGDTIVLWEIAGTGHNQAKSFVEPKDGAILNYIGGVKRSYIVQPLVGEGHSTDAKGTPIPIVDISSGSQNGSVKFSTGDGGG